MSDMSRYIISLGSNIPSGDSEISLAIAWLKDFTTLLAATPVYRTPDAYDPSKPVIPTQSPWLVANSKRRS